MSCSQCVGIESEFNERRARKDAKALRSKGPSKTTRMLIDAIADEGVEGASLIDVGGGVGAIQLALIEAGVTEVTSVDASTAFMNAAREMARDAGVRRLITYVHGDFTEVADRLVDADVVTLDRVICCYDDMPGLVGASSARARRLYGLVYPRDSRLARTLVRLANAWLRIRGSSMRTFFHEPAAVEALLRRQGFDRVFRERTAVWEASVYARRA